MELAQISTSLDLDTSYYELKPKDLGIYIHVPWCLQKCHYCDFYSLGIAEEKKRRQGSFSSHSIGVAPEQLRLYSEKLIYELETRLSDQSSFRTFEKISSIYFGGGTPSLLKEEELKVLFGKLIESIKNHFDLDPNCEISLEANPENISPEYLEGLHALGIRRINVGIQSFQSQILKDMNRFYSPEAYASVLDTLSRGPFENYGLDLIYGFPGQSKLDFYRDLERSLSISPPHISVYSLTLESDTAYGKAVQKKKSPAPDEELQAEVWESLSKKLSKAKLQHYEVSNFARKDKWCRHNLSYWLYAPYLGLGPGAHGFDGQLRYGNQRSLEQWLQGAGQNPYLSHEASLEIPLMFLRLCAPWPLSLWENLLLERSSLSSRACEMGMECLYKWEEGGLADIFSYAHKKFFQWKFAGLSFLNDRILEMREALLTGS